MQLTSSPHPASNDRGIWSCAIPSHRHNFWGFSVFFSGQLLLAVLCGGCTVAVRGSPPNKRDAPTVTEPRLNRHIISSSSSRPNPTQPNPTQPSPPIVTLSHSPTLTLSHSHTPTLSHSHTLTLSHSHTHTLTLLPSHNSHSLTLILTLTHLPFQRCPPSPHPSNAPPSARSRLPLPE